MPRLARRSLALLPLLSGCGAERSAPTAAADPLRPLRPFFASLAASEQGGAREPVLLLQLGDSHTANDSFGTRMREVLQQRFGAAGRGPMAPGVPFRTYNPSLMRVSADAGWQAIGSLSAASPGPFGIAGVRQRADRAGAALTLETLVDGGLAAAEVEVLRRPGGGSLSIEVDGSPAGQIATGLPMTQAEFVKLPTGPDTRAITLRAAGDGPVELLSWSAARRGPGVLYANLGTIGATIETTARWDAAIVQTELTRLRPALLLIAFGTNEGFRPELDTAAYEATFAARVAALRAAAGGPSVLVMGPPDGDWPARRAGPGAAECADGTPGRDAWRKPPFLAAVRAAQARAAAANGWSFWDWARAMGGDCAMHRWATQDPPLAAADHVHLRTAGYRITADALLRELLDGYARGRAVA